MAEVLSISRKRSRGNCDEECCDFMPLSKRINNLHINNCGSLAILHPDHATITQGGGFDLSSQVWLPPRQSTWVSHYSPDLGIDQNPYYYENNKLLYNLYVERMQRLGHPVY